MEIVIVAGGMPFSPHTLKHLSLGGSETAALSMAKELSKKDNIVNVFCNLPPEGRADFVKSGFQDEDKVRWMDIRAYQTFIANTEVDLLIVSRSPELFQVPHQARKAVLWCHDLATYKQMPALTAVAWNFDEIWAVSEYHRQQIHKVTGYPLSSIRATRNGVVDYPTDDWLGRNPTQLLYAARPERGLIELVRPGGIMSRLPELKLVVTMYDNFPEEIKPYYEMLFGMAEKLPNVELKGVVNQKELRQLMIDSMLYVYPTNFEEVSCIIARECISTKLPIITTRKGALPETLGDCGIYVENADYGTDEFAARFADEVRHHLKYVDECYDIQENMSHRHDLDWAGVADQWLAWADPAPVTPFSRIWSCIEDSDVVAAIAYAQSIPVEDRSPAVAKQLLELERLYPYLFGRETFAAYYERYFKFNQDPRGARKKPNTMHEPRFQQLVRYLEGMPDGSTVLDYGCAEGVNILGLAKVFPQYKFFGIDFAQSNIDLCRKYAEEDGLTNIHFECGETTNYLPGGVLDQGKSYNAIIFSEVMEHVAKPWELAEFLEERAVESGRMIMTVPQGPWEAIGLYDKNQYEWRAHIWHINKWMIRKMFADKVNPQLVSLTNGHSADQRQIGHLAFMYPADHKGVHAVDPVEKAMHHRSRHSVGAAIIAKDAEESIIKCLNSIAREVQQVHVAVSEDTNDDTILLVGDWAKRHPWVQTKISIVHPVQVREFGFDDARNASINGMDTDWILWIDTDEYLSGNVRKYCRANAFQSLAIHQHHFTVEPRGGATQLDKPARLFRAGQFKFYGKVHEHAEIECGKGPGFCFILPDVDIGHTGYVNENIRRDRFMRNFPLLEWDREVYPDRKLGKFLWLRDIIHRMRWVASERNVQGARLLAQEAIDFYEKECLSEDGLGAGDGVDIGYVSEAREFLGIGIKVDWAIRIDGADAVSSCYFNNVEEFATIVKRYLKGPLDKRKSGYWS